MDRDAFDTSQPNPARRYNYWLDGKDHFKADRESADRIEKLFPTIRIAAQQNRAFLRRAVTALTHAGIHQFIDLGAGIPAPGATHDVAQAIDPSARIVYVDNDPIVIVHSRALLPSHPDGRCAFLDADLTDPTLLASDEITDTLDLTQPVAVLAAAVLHFEPDDHTATTTIHALMDAVAPGSHLVISHATADLIDPGTAAGLAAAGAGPAAVYGRTRAQVTRFFDGLTLLEPGITIVSQWRPDTDVTVPDADVSMYGGVAVKT